MRRASPLPPSFRAAKRAAAVFTLVCAPWACSAGQAPHDVGGAGTTTMLAYLGDAAVRRSELQASLVNPSNGYSRLRLAHYASGDALDWDRVAEWNPRTEPIAVTELDQPGGASTTALSSGASPLSLPTSISSASDPALLALGKQAFFRYPVQLAPYMSVALASRAAAAGYGLWLDAAAGVGGLVRAQVADGQGAVALTCATCHAAPAMASDGSPGVAIDAGLPNRALAIGAAVLDYAPAPSEVEALSLWGPGRLDVTTDTGLEPVAIPDLRPVRWLTHLHRDATLEQRSMVTLATRIETLVITSNDQVVRPPRLVALALAAYIWSLADSLPSLEAATAQAPRGAALFDAACAGCHVPPALTGPPVLLATVGTDPTLGLSTDRGTGMYRVPSLHGVGTRGPLLHDGTIASVAALFDPARSTATFSAKLHGMGAVPGHTFGLELAPDDRAALVTFVSAL
jgi:mono/diheme cytochrome c family protein